MAQALLSGTLLTIAGIVATAILGYTASSGAEVARHILAALATVVVGLFAQSMTMFFFIGMGKEIKNAVRGHPDEKAVLVELRAFKSQVFPIAMYSIGALMVTFIIGGGVHTNKVPAWVHHGCAIASLVLYARAYWFDLRAMERNARLMERFLAEDVGEPGDQAR